MPMVRVTGGGTLSATVVYNSTSASNDSVTIPISTYSIIICWFGWGGNGKQSSMYIFPKSQTYQTYVARSGFLGTSTCQVGDNSNVYSYMNLSFSDNNVVITTTKNGQLASLGNANLTILGFK